MSMEYTAPVKLRPNQIKELAEIVEIVPAYEVLSFSVEDGMSLRIKKYPKRDILEDLVIYFRESDVLLMVHAAAGQERDEFINKITSALAGMGVDAEFEEI